MKDQYDKTFYEFVFTLILAGLLSYVFIGIWGYMNNQSSVYNTDIKIDRPDNIVSYTDFKTTKYVFYSTGDTGSMYPLMREGTILIVKP
jgi:hypothetical protein